MSYQNGRSYTDLRGINLQAGNGAIRFATPDVTPTTTTGERLLYVDATNRLTYDNGASTVIIGAAGGASTTWEDLYLNDATFALSTGTWTITQSAAVALLTLNKTNVGAGAVIAITNSGTGNDITGNASNFTVSAAGAVTCVSIADSAAGATLQVDGNAAGGVNIGSTSTGAITLGRATTITTGGLVVSDTGVTITTGGLTVSDTQILLSDGIADFLDNSNVLSSLRVTNNTATTWGVGGASTGVALLRSTSLTTGSLLSLQLAEGALVGGFYLRCFDTTGGGDVLTFGEDGAIVITGLEGSNMLTVTAGDVSIPDGSVTITDDDNAASFSVTNNTATTANVVAIQGSGVFTGSGTSAFVSVEPSGLTTGDCLNITSATLTTGNGLAMLYNGLTTGNAVLLTSTSAILDGGSMLSIVADSATTAGATTGGLIELSCNLLTTGMAFDVSSSSINLSTGGLLNVTHTSSGAIVAKTTFISEFFGSRTNTAAAVISDDYDLVSIIRTNVNTNAGGTLNAAGAVLRLENIATPTAGTLTDTAAGLEIVMDADGTGNGVTLTHNNTTTASAMVITASMATTASVIQVTTNALSSGSGLVWTANGITTGTLMRLTSSGVITGAGELVDLIASGATTSSGVVRLTCNGLTTGTALSVTSSGVITGGAGFVELTPSGLTTGDALAITAAALTTGRAIVIAANAATTTTGVVSVTANGLTTGSGLLLTSSGVIVGAGKLVELVASGATTATAVFDYTLAGLTTGTAFRITANALTTGSCITLVSSLAGQTAASVSYLACNNGAADVFSIGVEGHVELRQTTAPTAVVTTANGITGASLTAGSTDMCGKLEMTGTSTGSSQVTVTFNQAFANPPRVFIAPATLSAGNPNTQWFVDAVTTTTFRVTVGPAGTYAATPQFSYWVIETGVAAAA